jgi:hypothetical protein
VLESGDFIIARVQPASFEACAFPTTPCSTRAGRKLERFGEVVLVRPDPGAVAPAPRARWKRADAFVRVDRQHASARRPRVPDGWPLA